MFGKKKETKEDKKKLKEIALETAIEQAGLTGLLDDNTLKLFKRLRSSKRGVGLSETSGFFGSSERQNLLTIVSQNIVIREQNDMIIQLLAQIANNTKQSGDNTKGE
jgi:hypothetical protein|nr:MAG TPA: hypothetical protein [Caudoviricetes sp.]